MKKDILHRHPQAPRPLTASVKTRKTKNSAVVATKHNPPSAHCERFPTRNASLVEVYKLSISDLEKIYSLEILNFFTLIED